MPINIIQDTDREFTVRITLASTNEPLDLTGVSGSDLKMKLTGENAPIELEEGSGLAIVSALGGKVKATLTPAQTLALKARDGQDIEIYIVISGKKYKVQLQGELNVKPCLFED